MSLSNIPRALKYEERIRTQGGGFKFYQSRGKEDVDTFDLAGVHWMEQVERTTPCKPIIYMSQARRLQCCKLDMVLADDEDGGTYSEASTVVLHQCQSYSRIN